MADRDHVAQNTTYTAQLAGHFVALEFDQKLLVLNRARLIVDGDQVDAGKLFFGGKTLSTELADGTKIEVEIDSGAMGELTRAQVRQGDGSWVDLQEQSTEA